jgi:Fe-S cluster assembly protein SufB
MLHLGKNTTSRIISKGIAAGHSQNTYRGLVPRTARPRARATSPTATRCLIGDKCGAHTVPYIEAKNSSPVFEHEATTSKISEDMLFYCLQRGLSAEEAVALGGQRLRQGRAAAAADGVRRRGAEADLGEPRKAARL